MDLPVAKENPLIHNLHNYCMLDQPCISVVDELPPLPTTPTSTPTKPPAAKKMKAHRSQKMDEGNLVQQISVIFNTRLNSLEKNMEKLISDNTMKIEGLKKTVDFVCADIWEVKQKIKKMISRPARQKKNLMMWTKGSSSWRTTQRWNLRLYGVPESKEQDVRTEMINICQAILPEFKTKFPDVIDTVHCLGQMKKDVSKTRGIIMQFTARFYHNKVWKAAKKSTYLQNKNLRFAEDLSQSTRERRRQLWPLVAKAREQGKSAYYVRGRAFVEGTELIPTV